MTNLHRNIRSISLFIALTIIWIILDQLSKSYFLKLGIGFASNGLMPYLFTVKVTINTGGAWSLFSDSTIILTVISSIVCVVIIIGFLIICARSPQVPILTSSSLALVLAGGMGNLIDRLVYGYVIDFIDLSFIEFPIFNIADIGVTCGIVLFVISFIFNDLRIDGESPDSEHD